MQESHEPRTWEDRLAAPMFALSLLYLVVFAGLIHRYPRAETTTLERQLISCLLTVLWLFFFPDAIYRFQLMRAERGARAALKSLLLILLAPPLRMAAQGLLRPNHIWLPRLGWLPIDNDLRRLLERLFGVPMILIALMILPLLVIEHCWDEAIRSQPWLALGLDVGVSVIWLAFAIELIIMLSVAKSKLEYCIGHWVDLFIVVLPILEVLVHMLEEVITALPMLRLLRLSRVLRLDLLSRFGRLYRLRSLAFKAWRAFLVLELIQRAMGHGPARRLAKLEELLRVKEDEVADLRREIEQLREEIARQQQAEMVPALAVIPPAGLESEEKPCDTSP